MSFAHLPRMQTAWVGVPVFKTSAGKISHSRLSNDSMKYRPLPRLLGEVLYQAQPFPFVGGGAVFKTGVLEGYLYFFFKGVRLTCTSKNRNNLGRRAQGWVTRRQSETVIAGSKFWQRYC